MTSLSFSHAFGLSEAQVTRTPPQVAEAGITDQGEIEMGTKPVRHVPDRVCPWWLCWGGQERQSAFL